MKLIIENWKRFINESNDVSTIIKDLLKNSSCSIEEINNGQCEDFMMNLISELPEDAIERTIPFDSELPGHYWVEFRGKHYDAETPDGVNDWRELPIFEKFFEDLDD